MKDIELMIKSIKINNIGISERILKAFHVCDRAIFVKDEPYIDEPRHIAHGQTISQPSTVARMLMLLQLEPGLDVLEIGTNTGYHAALAAWLVWPGSVKTIEIFPDLAEQARNNLKKLVKLLKKKKKGDAKKFSKTEIFTGDAFDKKTKIWNNKYDRIYFTAGISQEQIKSLKAMALKLLKDKGLLLYPTRKVWDYGSLEVMQKEGDKLKIILKEKGYAFVPLLRKEDLEELYKKSR